MPKVVVSAKRFASMLANRNLELRHFSDGLQVQVDLERLVTEDLQIEFDDVLELAKRFKRPWPYLLADVEEQPPRHIRDNRTFLNRRHPLSAEVVDQILAVESMLEVASELFRDVRYEVPDDRGTFGTSADAAAKSIRAFLSISARDQIETQGDYGALRMWSDALQARGVYVSMRRLNDPTVRAFSIATDQHAVVVADTQDGPNARVFSLIHEYMHIVLRSEGLCDLSDHADIERHCNAVAALVLMPDNVLAAELTTGHRWEESLDDDERELGRLAGRLGVSKASLLIRLRDFGALSQPAFESLEARRQERRGPEKAKGGQYYPAAINKVGRRFARNVIGAFEQGDLNRPDASVLLEIPEHNFDRFRHELASPGRSR